MTTNPNRTPAGVPTGGQFAASARGEADVALNQVAEAPGPTAEQVETEQRHAAYERLKDFGIDGTASTITWPEEPNVDDDGDLDGTFDVDLNVVYDSTGTEVEDIGGQGAEPAGWYDQTAPDGYRTAYDIWREDPDNPASDIDLAKMQHWYAEHRTAEAFATLNRLAPADADGNRWAANESDWDAAEAARLEAQTPTPFVDLVPGDRFVIERYPDGYTECRVLDEARETKDRFGRTMQAFMVRRQDSGGEGLYTFGPGGVARKVEKPVHMRTGDVDAAARAAGYRSHEHMLNEGFGV